MQKAGALIERLLEQYRNNAGKEQLRATTQLLLYELENDKETVQSTQQMVSVFFPSASHFNINKEAAETVVLPQTKKEQAKFEEQPAKQQEAKQDNKAEEQNYFDPMVEIPTLALKQQEVNETIAKHESLNDKLKSSLSAHKEIGHKIKDGPIKDLRKAIGINDQYLFINELFRGDQTMYERSIKTINSFNIYGEAELWIKRELKLKLGWDENSEVVQLFDQLTKRRFA